MTKKPGNVTTLSKSRSSGKKATEPKSGRQKTASRTSKSAPASSSLKARAEALAAHKIEFVFDPSFHHPEVAETLLSDRWQERPTLKTPEGLPAYMESLYEIPLLTQQEEKHLFLRMNFLKWKANEIREGLMTRRPTSARVEEIERLLADAVQVRNQIVQANLRLVVSIAKKFADTATNIDDLICEAHLPLMRAVELFNIGRGNRFSTYATWAVRNHFIRSLSDGRKQQTRFSTSEPFVFEKLSETRSAVHESEAKLNRQRHLVEKLLEQLPERDQLILAARFGLADHGPPRTLAEIGVDHGISKERVRQLTIRALDRLREVASEEPAELAEA